MDNENIKGRAKMNKKELQEREIKLEAIIAAYDDLIANYIQAFPVYTPDIQHLENVAMALYNAAEVREGIEDLVNFSVEYEKEKE